MIRLINVSLSISRKTILSNISLNIVNNEIMVIIGPSGSGKSTLLRMLIGLIKPTTGQIWIDGCEISKLAEYKLNEIRKRMGMVFQYSALFDSMTVQENVAFGLKQHTTLSDQEIERIVRRKLQMVGLKGFEAAMPNELSGGMKKRVSFARAIAINPKIILYDEPTAGLDPIMAHIIERLVVGARRILGVTSVIVTHDMNSAFYIADRIALICEGKIIELGTVDQIKKSKNPFTIKFLNILHNTNSVRKVEKNEIQY